MAHVNARPVADAQQSWLFFSDAAAGRNQPARGQRRLTSRRHPSPASTPDRAALLATHAVAYLTALLLVLTPWQALAFFGMQQGLFGVYMGASFAPNHKGMPILPAADKSDYVRRQVPTSRHVRGGRVVDFDLVGRLNYQIEHHRFPSCRAATCAGPRLSSVTTAMATTSRIARTRSSRPTPKRFGISARSQSCSAT
jgi:hypothetical protein